MTVQRLGLRIRTGETVQRVNRILSTFAGGFNAMLTRPTWRGWQTYCKSLPALYRPFAEEGAAMGYTPRRMFLFSPSSFERDIVRGRAEFRYLYYVGLGFWSGMRGHQPQHVQRRVERLDPMHRFLCFDGYGFKRAFFDYPRDPGALTVLGEFERYARRAAYQGVGRAFYFLFMEDPAAFIEHTRRLEAHAADVAAGAGLAAVFVNPDRLELARAWAEKMPEPWRPHVHLGMCFGLKARSINDLEAFEGNVARLEPSVQDAVWASIRECDRVELVTRDERRPEGYADWRTRVTEWMSENIEFPLAGIRSRGVDKDVRISARGR